MSLNLLPDRFNRQIYVDFTSKQRGSGSQSPFGPVDSCGSLPTTDDRILSPWVIHGAKVVGFYRDGVCLAHHRQIAGYLEFIVSDLLPVGGFKGYLGPFTDVKVFVTSKMLITVFVIGIDACDIDGGDGFIIPWIVLVEMDFTIEGAEVAWGLGHKVTNFEADTGMGPVNFVNIGFGVQEAGRRQGEYQAKELFSNFNHMHKDIR